MHRFTIPTTTPNELCAELHNRMPVSLGLVVVLGGATMLTQSPGFMMVKPTIVHFAVAAVMLRPGWMIRYFARMVVRNVPEPAIVAAGYGWAALLVALGLAISSSSRPRNRAPFTELTRLSARVT
jgi:intracellular septation protein A